MFKHLLQYYSKVYFYNKSNILWNFIFPFAYITVFFIAMSSINNPTSEIFDEPVHVAIISNSEQELNQLTDFLDNFGEEGSIVSNNLIAQDKADKSGSSQEETNENFLIYLKTDSATAENLLEKQIVEAIIIADNPVTFSAYSNLSSLKSSILNQFLESYESTRKTVTAIENRYATEQLPIMELGTEEIAASHQEVFDLFEQEERQNENIVTSSTLIYFFAALAYISFFPINSGVSVLEDITANQSKIGLRNSINPIGKNKMFFASLLPRWIIHCLFTVVIYFYAGLLGIDFGERKFLIVLLLILGTTSSVFTGTAIGALFSFSQSIKIGLSISLPLLFAFSSGMMYNGMRRMMDSLIPWFNQLNPLGIVSNGLYMLHSDPGLHRFSIQILKLGIYISIAFILTMIALRRKKHESV